MDENRKNELLKGLQARFLGTPVEKIYLDSFENDEAPKWIRFAVDKEQVAAELNRSLEEEAGKRRALEEKLKEIRTLAS
jgi:hypothetical protein